MSLSPTIASECLFLTGPTASGKTALGARVAERLGAEIVSMDSMAMYRRMDIGTAKASKEDRQRVPHHLVDILEPWEEFSLAQYLGAAEHAVREIRARGRVVLFVGGTPLYLKCLLRGAQAGTPPDRKLRAHLHQEAERLGTVGLHQRLNQVDPAAGRRIHPNDLRRIVRALEVFEKTGTPISIGQVHFQHAPNPSARVACLVMPRERLYQRIDQRVRRMFSDGLVQEVRSLLQLEPSLSRTARQALGYKQVIDYLEDRMDLAETIELVGRRTRQFAKRQHTWFRGIAECQQLPLKDDKDQDRLADQVCESWADAT